MDGLSRFLLFDYFGHRRWFCQKDAANAGLDVWSYGDMYFTGRLSGSCLPYHCIHWISYEPKVKDGKRFS